MATRSPKGVDLSPPPDLDEAAADVWREIVAAHPKPATIIGPDLEAYCGQVALVRECRGRVAEEGAIAQGSKREPIPHPAIAVAKQALEYVAKHAARFAPPAALVRRSGTMVDATRRSILEAKHLRPKGEDEVSALVAKRRLPVRPEYEALCTAVLTLAWQIDEAQRRGYEALEKATFGPIPTYIKGCSELQITPATLPAGLHVAPAPSNVTDATGRMNGPRQTARERRRAKA